MAAKTRVLLIIFFIFTLLIIATGTAQARENYRGVVVTVTRSMSIEQIEASKESCVQCHSKITPMIVSQHQSSAHTKAGLSCSDCHGNNHKEMPIVTGKRVCNKCHAKETKEMLASKHAVSWDKMWYNGRYWSQSVAIRQQGCNRCHDIGSGFGNMQDVRCDYCHNTHEFSVQEAKNPAVCGTCHMGPDHPQAEAYNASAHSKQSGVTCITCHQTGGSHNVSQNIGIGGVSNGAVVNTWSWVMDGTGRPILKRPVISESDFSKARDGNMAICNKCHTPEFNQQWLNGADQVKILIDQQLLEAQKLVEQLNKEGLLYPDPASRPANPIDGQKLVLGGNQLYSGTSKAEAIYFKMYKFAAAQSWKSAYHQDFQRAGTKGIMEMKQLMVELQDEANVLRSLGSDQKNNKNNSVQATVSQPKSPNYLLFGLAGLLLGVILAIAAYFLKGRKSGWLTNLFLFFLICVGIFSFPKDVMAWDKNSTDQKQCSTCHQEQARQLKSGKHASLQCLSCHEQGAAIDQVKRPETCGKCHNDSNGYQLETYQTSPHGVQYQVKGLNQWVPTCTTCHMPQGTHNPLGKLAGNNTDFKGNIGEVCLKCHTTDHVIKFNQDKVAIFKQADNLTNNLKQVGMDLIAKGIVVPENSSDSKQTKDIQKKWGQKIQWKMVNIERLTTPEQEIARKLINDLDNKTKEGLVNANKMRIGTVHVNPDFTHWYGNAYLNLNLSEVQNTGKEIEMLAMRTGYSSDTKDSNKQTVKGILIALAASFSGFTLTIYLLRRRKLRNK